jgi:ubiquitin-conjugating enzyme E2 D/E
MAESRIYKEIEDMYSNPPYGVTAGPIDDNDIKHWEATIIGPEETDYKDGIFLLDIKIPDKYPYEPPICKFKTKILHPNIDPDTGHICLTILKPHIWNPSMNISNMLLTIMLLFHKPKFDDPWNSKATDLYNKSVREKSQEYSNEVKRWVREYASRKSLSNK